jgi:hypothetical protein
VKHNIALVMWLPLISLPASYSHWNSFHFHFHFLKSQEPESDNLRVRLSVYKHWSCVPPYTPRRQQSTSTYNSWYFLSRKTCSPLHNGLYLQIEIFMAPVDARRAGRRGGTGRGRPYRNANTNAGVNRHQARAPRGTIRDRGTHHRANSGLGNGPVRPTLAGRMTYGDGRGGTARPRPQARPAIHSNNNAFTAVNPYATTNTDPTQPSSRFYNSQPTQPTDDPPPLSPPRPSSPPPRPIRILNEDPFKTDDKALPKRPINNYRGKDPIKRLVQNKKLQAILADKPLPRERQKAVGDRMELRLGVKGGLK